VSFSNLYSKGKFVQDGHFDPNAVSKQCGAALMLKAVAAPEKRQVRAAPRNASARKRS
jgi:lysozyme family protein